MVHIPREAREPYRHPQCAFASRSLGFPPRLSVSAVRFGLSRFRRLCALRATPGSFLLLLQTKALSLIVPSVAPAWRLGGPWATLGPPKGDPIPDPIPIPNKQRVVGFRVFKPKAKSQKPSAFCPIAKLLFSKSFFGDFTPLGAARL